MPPSQSHCAVLSAMAEAGPMTHPCASDTSEGAMQGDGTEFEGQAEANASTAADSNAARCDNPKRSPGRKRAAADDTASAPTSAPAAKVARTMHQSHKKRILQFYSKSKDVADLAPGIPANWRKVLSNFWRHEVTVDGATYPSAEAAYHAAKALCSSNPGLAKHFEVGGRVGSDPRAAKKAGSRKELEARGALLDRATWDQYRDAATVKALESRLKTDELFVKVLRATREQNVHLVHFDRSGPKSYWGAFVKEGRVCGRNRLGELLMELREEMD